MKRGSRSRKRKASEVKDNSSAAPPSAAVCLEDSPKQCLTQNSNGKFVPCFSKKPRLAVKTSGIPATEPLTKTPATTCTTVGELEVPEQTEVQQDNSKVLEETETNNEHKNDLLTTKTGEIDAEVDNAEKTIPDTVKAGPAVTDVVNAESCSDNISLPQTSSLNIPGMSLSQIVTPIRREENDEMISSCSQPVKLNSMSNINAPLLQVKSPHGIQLPCNEHTEPLSYLEQALPVRSPITPPQQGETTPTQKNSEEKELAMMRDVLELEDSLTGMDDLENLSMDFSEEVVMAREGGQSGDVTSLVKKPHPHTEKAILEKEALVGLYSQLPNAEQRQESLSAAIVPTMSPSNHCVEATVPAAGHPSHKSSPPLQEGTNMLRGLVDELSALNRFILNCKRELDAGLRQRRAWLRLQQSTSRNK